MILHQLPHRPHPSVPEMVDVVGDPVAILELDQVTDYLKDIFSSQRALIEGRVDAQLVVQFQAPNPREVVALGVEEEVVKKQRRGLQCRGVAGSESPVDFDDGFLGRRDFVLQEGVAQRRPNMRIVNK